MIRQLRGKKGVMSDDECAQLLKQHLEETERIHKQRQSERDRLKEKLKQKLRNREEAGEDGEEDGLVQEDTVDEQTEEQVAKLEEDFKERFLRERHELSEEELQSLLEEHRRQKENLRQRQATSQLHHQDKVKRMLAEKKRRKLKTTDKKLSTLDEQFFADLQTKQQQGKLSKEQFSELLQVYMNSRGEVKKEERQRRKGKSTQQSDHEIRENVSNLVLQHQEETRQLNDLRQRQKDIMDQRLQSKLAAKKSKRTEEGVED